MSKSKPYCDNSHKEAGFRATCDVRQADQVRAVPLRGLCEQALL